MRSQLSIAAAILVLSSVAVSASDYPTRPVKVVVPYPAGSSDVYIRGIQDDLEKKHGITFLIVPVTGAGGIVGTTEVKNSEPNGYTLLFCASGALTTVNRFQSAQYTMADFIPIINLVNIPLVIGVNKDSPFNTFKDFVEYGRKNPGKLTFGSPGTGTIAHLLMEGVMQKAGIEMIHVPYGGAAPALTATLGGHTDAVVGVPSTLMPLVRSGQLKALGISSRERFGPAKEVPTLRENGVDLELSVNFGLLAPKGTPQDVVEKLVNAVDDIASKPEYGKAMENLGTQVSLLKLSDYGNALRAEDKTVEDLLSKMPKR